MRVKENVLIFTTEEKKAELQKELVPLLTLCTKITFKTKSVRSIPHLVDSSNWNTTSILLDESWWNIQKREDLEEFLLHENYGSETFVLTNNEDILKPFSTVKRNIKTWDYRNNKNFDIS